MFVIRRFAASGTVTAEEQEQRILYTNVLEYEQDHVSLSHFYFFTFLKDTFFISYTVNCALLMNMLGLVGNESFTFILKGFFGFVFCLTL